MKDQKERPDNAFLIGENIYLRGHEKSDLESNWFKWFNDQSVTKFMRKGVFPNTYENQVSFFEHLQNDEHKIQLAIIHKSTNKFIGVVSISDIDWVSSFGEIAIVIGEEEYRGRRNGLEAMALMMYHGFTKMNLNRIWAGQHIGLKSWKEALEKYLCFKQEATLRQAIFSHGKYHDVVIIGALAEDFLQRLEGKNGDPIAMLEE